MKKNFLKVLAASMAVVSLASCGKGGYDETVKAINGENKYVGIVGANEIKSGEEWVANAWDITETNKATALSVKGVSELDTALADAIKDKDIAYIYTKDIRVGAYDAGWTSNAFKDGKVYVYNGSYTVKAIEGTYDADDDAYSQDQWISDPKTAHVESLTPSTLFFPTWQEAKDENGFAWDQNPVVIGDAGVYTIVLVKYNAASTAEVCGYGMAALLKEKIDNGLAPVEYEAPAAWVWADHTYGAIGSFNEWETDVAMTLNGSNYTCELELAENAEVKVRADGAWDNSWGTAEGGNVSVAAAGTYIITLDTESGVVTAELAD